MENTFFKDFKSSSLTALKNYAWIPLLILGFVLYLLGGIAKDYELVSKSLHSIGTTIVTATVFVTIVKSKQFTDIFKKQLREIIYCTEYLKNRKDIKDLWITTSKSMYQENFPDLCDKIEENLEKYIPMDSNKYYENYTYKVDIEFDVDNPDFIILNERETFTLHAHTIEKTDYISSCVFKKNNYEDEISNYEMILFKVNNKEIKPREPQLVINKKHEGNKISVVHKRILNGDKKYKIEKVERKKYSLKVENTKSHSCLHIFKNYNLEITHPKDLEVKFYENGTLNNFTKLPIRNIGKDIISQRFEYEGIMFKNQGTRIIFRDLRK